MCGGLEILSLFLVNRESEKFKDIIQGDFLDTYHNLSYKVGVASKQGSYV